LAQQHYEAAAEKFRQVLNPEITPKFFLHWYWRMNAQFGLSNVWLASGKLAAARTEADCFLASAASTADPNLQALAWELQARVAMAENDWPSAQANLSKGLALLERFEIPTVAWRVHVTGAELYGRAKDKPAADTHRARADAVILALANSFAPDEPLRHAFLAAAPLTQTPPVRRGNKGGRPSRNPR